MNAVPEQEQTLADSSFYQAEAGPRLFDAESGAELRLAPAQDQDDYWNAEPGGVFFCTAKRGVRQAYRIVRVEEDADGTMLHVGKARNSIGKLLFLACLLAAGWFAVERLANLIF